jgi:hypothetical protein
MGIFDRLRKRGAARWAPTMTPEELDQFVKLVETDLRRRGVRFSRRDAVVNVTAGKESGLPPGAYHLSSLAQQCKQAERREWEAGIARHFDMAIHGSAAAEHLSAIVHDYPKVASLLRVRIYPPEWTTGHKDEVVLRHDLPGLATVLCFDLPTMVVPVRKEQAASWSVGVETAFEQGIENSTQTNDIDKQTVDVGPAMGVTVLIGDPVWHCANVLILDRLVGPAAAYGALVALPHRHIILVHQIMGGDLPELIGGMGRMARGLYDEGPGSISSDLYWHIDGRFERIPVDRTEQGTAVMLTPEFQERVMKPLGFAST